MVYSLFYLSSSKFSLTDQDLEEMSHQFRIANKANAISGILIYDQKKFFQYIEGPEKNIRRLMQNIVKDSKHEILVNVDSVIGERRFDGWGMRILDLSNLNRILPENELIDLIMFSAGNPRLIAEWESKAWVIIDKIAEQQNILD
ncbi:MAG: hypothetical protein ACI9A7_000508 [Cyclobacteriaceae bacterium]|jgi:hypothetical protein